MFSPRTSTPRTWPLWPSGSSPPRRSAPTSPRASSCIRNFWFPEEFKAVHIPAAGLALFDAVQRCEILKRAGDHIGSGGFLIISTQEVRRSASSLVGAGAPAIQPVEHLALEGRRKPGLHWDVDLETPQSQLIASSWLANTCTRLGMAVSYQRSRPDPSYPGHMHVTLAAQQS